jgi:FlaA1/EpsC-like NDP-sugar epimerase
MELSMSFLDNKAIRLPVLAVLYAAILAVALYTSFQLRFDFYPSPYLGRLQLGLFLNLGITIPLLWAFGQFRSLLSYFSLPDAQKILTATGLANLAMLVAWYAGWAEIIPPRAVIVLNFLLGTAGLISLRLGFRLARERWGQPGVLLRKKRRVAIYGAGTSGAQLVSELLARPNLRMEVAALFDDDSKKAGTQLHGVRVLGDLAKLRKSGSDLQLDEIILAMPTADPSRTRAVVAQCRRLNLPVRTIPTIHNVINGHLHLDRIKPVEFEDLLARESVEMEAPASSAWIAGRKVLVTGAGGTIGAELARQIWACHPKSIVLIERSEPALFEIEQELKEDGAGSEVAAIVSDVGDEKRMDTIFNQQKPDLVFHAAAHKHVPLMEQQVGEALTNNSLKTMALAKVATRHGTKDFVMISTDKAINPTNVMGASKRLAELGLQILQKQNPNMKITSVRFGNVLGSSGSVIPTFRRQIAAGGPVTVTHPEVTRYFMSVAEAVGLVLSAGRLSQGGEIFVLDMGEPVKIEAMARQLIELSGFEPGREIEIRYTGLRPGEKLYEELSQNEEITERTEHAKIWKLKPKNSLQTDSDQLVESIHSIIEEAERGNTAGSKQMIKKLIPEYTPWLG